MDENLLQNNKPTVTFPEKAEVDGNKEFKEKTNEKFKNIDTLIFAVVVAIIVSSIASLISVGAIVIDQLHFNNQTYRSELESQKQNFEILKDVEAMKVDIRILQNKK